MKTNISLLFAVLLMSTAVSAQQFRTGVKAGFNHSTLYVDDVEDTKIRPGFHVGFFGQSKVADVVAIQTELLYTTAGNRTTYEFAAVDGTVDFNMNYLQLPVMINLKLLDIMEFHAGAYLSYLLSANTSHDGDLGSSYEELDKDNFNPLDYGLATGLGVNFGNLQVGVRYNFGLNEVAKSDNARSLLGESKNVVGQIYAAIGF